MTTNTITRQRLHKAQAYGMILLIAGSMLWVAFTLEWLFSDSNPRFDPAVSGLAILAGLGLLHVAKALRALLEQIDSLELPAASTRTQDDPSMQADRSNP